MEELVLKSEFNTIETRSMFKRGERDYSVDILRCFSCFMVILGHAPYFFDYSNTIEAGSLTWAIVIAMRCFFTSGTTMFVMVSGIFFLSPERHMSAKKIWSKNVLKLSLAYIVWSLLYALFRMLYTDPKPISLFALMEETLIEEDHLWYIPMIIGIYVMVPILRIITENAKIKHYKYMIGLMIAAFTLNTIYSINEYGVFPYGGGEINAIILKTPMNDICQYFWYAIFGYYLYTYRPSPKIRKLIYVLGVISFATSFLLNVFLYLKAGNFESGSIIHKFTITTFGKNTAIFLFIISFFSDIKLSDRTKKIISKISASTLFIYLAHWMIL